MPPEDPRTRPRGPTLCRADGHGSTCNHRTAPSDPTRTVKGSAVVTIGVGRGGVGRDNGTSGGLLPFTRRWFLAVRLAAAPKKLLG